MSREITSFSRIEFEAIRSTGALDADILEGEKLRAMKLFRDDLPALTREIDATAGAFSNLKTIRVMEGYVFLYTPTLPPAMFLRQREAAKPAAVAEAKAEAVQKPSKDSRPPRRQGKPARRDGKPEGVRQRREDFLRSPEGSRAAFNEARKQSEQQEKDRVRKLQQKRPQPKPIEVVRLPTQVVKRAIAQK